MPSSATDRELVQRIRRGEEQAWRACIAEYEGRLQAFVYSRLRDRDVAEDLVQETFLGFLTALPNYDDATPVETFLFAIAAHKITDTLRRQGRRPVLKLEHTDSSGTAAEFEGHARGASTIARSHERQRTEEQTIADCLQQLVRHWLTRGEVERLKCAELLFVQGMPNKEVALALAITEQDVANHKHFILGKLRDAARREAFQQPELDRLGLNQD